MCPHQANDADDDRSTPAAGMAAGGANGAKGAIGANGATGANVPGAGAQAAGIPGKAVARPEANVPALREAPRPLAPYGFEATDAGAEQSLDVREYLRILFKRKWIILCCALAFTAIGTARTLMLTPIYTSTLRLQIDRNVAKVVENGNVSPLESGDIEFLRTQYELLQGRSMAERVASALKLGEDSDFFRPREFSMWATITGLLGRDRKPGASQTPNSIGNERAAAGIILANRAVIPISGSRLVEVSYNDPSPQRAQRIAMAYADAFIASNLDKRVEANAYAKTFLEDEVKQLKGRLEVSEQALLDFAQQQQIDVFSEKSSIAEENLAAANVALGNLVAERIKNEQLWRQVEKSDAINLPQLLSNAAIDGLRTKRNELVVEYQDKLETYKPNYPLMIQIKNKMGEIDRQLANEVTTIKQSFRAAYDNSRQQEEQMTQRVTGLKSDVLDLQQRSIKYNILKREVDTNRSLYEGLLHRYKEVDVAGGVDANNVFVADRAEVPGSPSSPQVTRSILIALLLGLGAGLATALLLERLDDRFHSVEEVERRTGLATLGIVPKYAGRGSPEDGLKDPQSGLSEGYRSFCTALQFSTDRGLPKTVLFTSSMPAEGKSTSALASAMHFARMGMRVLIIDADMRNGSLHKKLGLEKNNGLSNYLTGAATPPEVLQRTSVPTLAFMAAGPYPPNAADLLASPRLLTLLSEGLEVFDLIILDGPPVMGLADVALLSNAAAATVFIVGAGEARIGPVQTALRRLQIARSPVIGALLTKFDPKNSSYGYGYGYGYSYGGYGQHNSNPAEATAGMPGNAGLSGANPAELAFGRENV